VIHTTNYLKNAAIDDSDFVDSSSTDHPSNPPMSPVEVLTAFNPIDYFISNNFSKFFGHSDTSYDSIISTASIDAVATENRLDDEKIFSSLPPLFRGHPETHLWKGIMDATRRAAVNEADAERAFFVADLSQIFRQHERWMKYLPEIVPHYGLLPVLHL